MNQSPERASSEVRNLLQSLNQDNHESVTRDLSKYFVNGIEESTLVVAICLDPFNIFEGDLEGTDIESDIASLFRNMIQKPHFHVIFAALVRNILISEEFLDNLSTELKLSACEKIGFGLSLLDSENNGVITEGKKFCMSQCKELCDIDDILDLDTIAADVLDVLRFLEQSEVLSKHVDSFKLMILEVWLNANSRLMLADKPHDSKLLSEIDFQIVEPTETPKETRASHFARMIGSWNQLSSRCGELLAQGNHLRADVTFSLLMSCYRNTCQAPFPHAAVCGNVWKNTGSQLLFLKHAVSSQPEVFTFAHCKRQLEYVDHKFQPWLCIDLLDVLCQLAEKGHITDVWSLMESPIKNCPEVLLLGMAHVITSYNLLQKKVSQLVLPMLVKDSSKSEVILHLWHINPLLLSRTLNDCLDLPENINRVVGLFQELEILVSVLDLVPMSLGIKLAAIASSKEFIDLEEWLGTNLSALEDPFFEECLKFLKDIDKNSNEIWSLCKEATPTFLKVLKVHSEMLASNKLTDQMESLYVTCMQTSPKMERNDDPDSSTSESNADHSKTKMQNSSIASTGSTPGKVSVNSAMFGCPININTLLVASGKRDTPIEIPPSEAQNKILFMINNLSAANIEEKAKEFTAILAEPYYPWFAQYLVIKRASIEPNFHNLYLNFLEQTGSNQLIKEIVELTYENCQVLLKSNLIKSSVEERKLLKNLGSWLGKLTIGRNQPLLAKHIDPQSLITEAYEKGLMIGVIPFISKILELCQSSVAYQLPNPWTMAILGLLVEIHSMKNLKANLTFEIEVLFKNLNVDIKEVKPTSLLQNKARITEGNPDFSQRKIVEEVKSTVGYAVNPVELPAEAPGPSHQGGISHIVYQPSVPDSTIPGSQSSGLDKHFKSLLPMAMNMAIEELVSTLVQRSVSIASQTAIELALKEYIYGRDEEAMHSACSMVVTLAGSLSCVTCKEPLRDLMSAHLRNSVKALDIASEFLEDSIQRVIDPNLHLGCASIEKNATEKGLITVRRELPPKLSIRRKQKEATNNFTQKAIEPAYTVDTALEKFQALLMKLERLTASNANEDQMQSLAAEVRAVILKCIRKDEAALAMAQKAFEGLYENELNVVNTNSRLTMLAALCDANECVGKELTGWVLQSDHIKFNQHITVGLIRRQLLNLAEYSFHMARLINTGKSRVAIEFSISLMQNLETVIDARVISELHHITDALSKATYGPVIRNEDNNALESSQLDPFRARVSTFLTQWCQMHGNPGLNDAIRAHYVHEVYRNILSKSDDMPNHFFFNLLELAISHYRTFETNSSPPQFHQQEQPSSIVAIGVFTDLVFSILKFCPVNHKSYKLSLFSKVLNVMTKFIMNDANEKRASFDARPYFWLFINLLNHLNPNSLIEDADFEVQTALAFALHALQPTKVSEFSLAWVELVSLRDFMPKLLNEENQKGWPYFHCLLLDLLRFLEPFLRMGELTDTVRVLYSGALRILMLLSHEFPEFIRYYHSSLSQMIPPQCIELQTILLSALPNNMRIPNPGHPQFEGQSAGLDKSDTVPFYQHY